MSAMKSVGIVGTGNIGRSWAIVFARAGYQARLHDPSAASIVKAEERIAEDLDRMEAGGLIGSAPAVARNVIATPCLEEALQGVVYVQESAPEDRDIKAELFARLDAIAGPDVILGSSCSAIPGSSFMEVSGKRRCLIVHPVSPPHLIPLVELVPTRWTDDAVLAEARRLMAEVGQIPVLIRKEVYGFALNRLQAALVDEAVQLVADGVISPDDLDKTIRDGLGLRWAFMGPFETMDLNDDGGFAGYTGKYAAAYEAMGRELKVAQPWPKEALDQIDAERRGLVAKEQIAERQLWRNARLIALLLHKREATKTFGA